MKRDVIILIIGRIFQALIGLISIRVATFYLEAEQMGTLSLIVSLGSYLSLAIYNPVGLYVNRMLIEWSESGLILKNLKSFFMFMLLSLLLICPVLVYFKITFSPVSDISVGWLIPAVLLGVLFNTWHGTLTTSLNFMGRKILFVLLNNLSLFLTLVLGILFVTLYGKLPLAWYSGQILAQAIVTLIGFLFLYSNYRKNESNTTLVTRDYGKVFNFCWPLSIANILLWAQTESFRFILEKNATLEFLGNLSVGISLSISMASVIESLLHQIYLPTYYREINQSSKELRDKAWSRMIATLTPVIISATIFIILFSPFIMRLLVDAKYTQFYLFLAFGMIIQLFRMLSNLLSFAGQAEMQNRPLMYSYGVGALITLAGTLYFTNSQYDLSYAIPLVLMVSAATSFLILFFISKKILSIHFESVPILKMMLMTLPFLLSLLLNNYQNSTLGSFVVLGFFGLYFLLIQYVFYKKVFKPHGI